MKTALYDKLGILLLAAGVIGGVAAASRTPVHTGLFSISIFSMILGIVLRKITGRIPDGAPSGEDRQTKSSSQALTHIMAGIQELSGEDKMKAEESRERLDRIQNLLLDDLPPVLAMADRLGISLGRSVRAETLSVISEGERYLNRAWSALSDGYEEEAKRSLETAGEKFRQVRAVLNSRDTGSGEDPTDPSAEPHRTA